MYTGPNIVKDNTLLYFDIGNVKSSVGEPTTNLLYNSGATNLSAGTDIYGKCTKTYLGGGKYRFVNNGTGVSAIRLYTNLSDLTNGYSYLVSVYYKDLTRGSISIDWCDSAVTGGISSSSLKENRLYGSSIRANNAYNFLDINLDSGASVTLYGDQVEYKTNVTPFVNGVRSVTQGLVPLLSQSKTSLDLTNMSYDSNSQLTFNGSSNNIKISDSIYNRTTGDELTICTVIKPGRNGGQYQDIVVNRSDTLYNWMLFQHTTDGSIQLHGAAQNKSTYIPTIGQYIHVAATVTSTGVYTLYINGVVKQTVTGYTYNLVTPSLLCVGCFGSGQEPYLGKIDLVKIHTRAFTQAEVIQDYNAVKARFNI